MNKEQFLKWLHTDNMGYKKPLVMGILNVTKDSFYDGGKYLDLDKATLQAQSIINSSVDIIDIGGESTRPGAKPVSIDEELNNVIPIIKRIRENSDICISIDTYKPKVMQEAIFAGANCINDIKALTYENSLTIASELCVPTIIMHMQGNPETMQNCPIYDGNVVDVINSFFSNKIDECLKAGICRQNLIIDPGFGFGKTTPHNLAMLNDLEKLQIHQLPVLLGVSRKKTIREVLGESIENSLYGGLGVAIFAAMRGISIIRTHDVLETHQALTMLDAINSFEEKIND